MRVGTSIAYVFSALPLCLPLFGFGLVFSLALAGLGLAITFIIDKIMDNDERSRYNNSNDPVTEAVPVPPNEGTMIARAHTTEIASRSDQEDEKGVIDHLAHPDHFQHPKEVLSNAPDGVEHGSLDNTTSPAIYRLSDHVANNTWVKAPAQEHRMNKPDEWELYMQRQQDQLKQHMKGACQHHQQLALRKQKAQMQRLNPYRQSLLMQQERKIRGIPSPYIRRSALTQHALNRLNPSR